MGYNATQVAWNIVEANQEYNTKLFILLLILVYSIAMLFYSYYVFPKGSKISDVRLSDVVKGASMRYFSGIMLLLYPLMTIFLFRGFSLSQMTNILWVFYGIIFTIVIIYGFLFGIEALAALFGLDWFLKNKGRKSTRK